MDLNTVFVILATGIVTSGGMIVANWVQHRWAYQREISNTRRKYRENIAEKVRGALEKIQERTAWISLSKAVSQDAEKEGFIITQKAKGFFNEMMGKQDIMISNGSACKSQAITPSHVLMAMGKSHDAATAALRFSVSHLTTEAEVDATVSILKEVVAQMQG